MENKETMFKEIKEWIFLIIKIIAIAAVIKYFIIGSTIVEGPSMEPTFKTGDMLFVNKISFMVDKVKKGDSVQFHNPRNDGRDFIKRVIAVEGDTVEIVDDRVYVNGEKLKEEYTSTNGLTTPDMETKWTIEKDEVFVLGDNRPKSDDSRSFGPIKKDSIVGIAFFRYYPLNKIGIL